MVEHHRNADLYYYRATNEVSRGAVGQQSHWAEAGNPVRVWGTGAVAPLTLFDGDRLIMGDSVRIAIVGVGYFGGLHAEKIARLPGAELVAVADINAERAEAVGRANGVPGFVDHEDLFGHVDAVSVAVPTVAHFEVASSFLDKGVHVLLEKPITDTPETARQLIDLAARRGVVLQIGHLERFSAPVVATRDLISRPLYVESNRIAPFKPRGTDVNVILDMMIHDIDLILTLVNAGIDWVDAVGAPVLSESEDIANARVRFTNGCVATITASRVSMKAERKMRIFQPDCYIGIDFLERSVRVVEKTPSPAPRIRGSAWTSEPTRRWMCSSGRSPPSSRRWLRGRRRSSAARTASRRWRRRS
jgi:predicted dehydrogenase